MPPRQENHSSVSKVNGDFFSAALQDFDERPPNNAEIDFFLAWWKSRRLQSVLEFTARAWLPFNYPLWNSNQLERALGYVFKLESWLAALPSYNQRCRPLGSISPSIFLRVCQQLLECGAEPGFVVEVLVFLYGDAPDLRRFRLIQEHLPRGTSAYWYLELLCIRRLLKEFDAQLVSLSFISFPYPHKRYICLEVARLLGLWVSYASLLLPAARACLQDCALYVLEQYRPHQQPRGRPAHDISTPLVALLVDHLYSRTGRPHYKEVGQCVAALIPGCFTSRAQKECNIVYEPIAGGGVRPKRRDPLDDLEDKTRDRYRKFTTELRKAGYDISGFSASIAASIPTDR
jgi:hypothetical protein